jgi:dihydroorotate dehydrogenase (NAD+) catalytic subunit
LKKGQNIKIITLFHPKDKMVDLSTSISRLKLQNPTMVASGILGETGESLFSLTQEGCGALVTKSIGMESKEGHSNPTFVETELGIINAMGLPNPGIEEYMKELSKARESNLPVIGSIFGKDEEEFQILAGKMEKGGASAIELNLSCPHAKGYGAELGHDPNKVMLITKAVKGAVTIPVFAKLSPNVGRISDIALAVEKAEGDGVVAINTLSAMAINSELAQPVLANVTGGLSGPAIKPVGLRCVYEIKSATELPIIGVGGILNGTDAVEYIMAGASAVQMGSGVYFRGKGIFKNVCNEISDFMKIHGYGSIEEMVGLAHKRQ